GVPETDNLRAIDAEGNPIPGGYNNTIGLHYTGYIYRGKDYNTDISLASDLVSQLNKNWQLKSGLTFTYYTLDRFQEAKAFMVIEDRIYHPYEGAFYIQNKLEFQGLIMNLGLRYDFYNPNDVVYRNIFDPFDLIMAEREKRDPKPATNPTSLFGQLSPRIGISHPISEKTVLHFSYGHFFQRANFGDYGEGTGGDAPGLTVSGILNTYLTNPPFGSPAPYNLGNRELKPRKSVEYELGVERNFGGLIVDVTGYYKDYTKTIRAVKIITLNDEYYLTTGNSDYADAKGIEISVRKPPSDYWGGYLNYSWSTGIAGTSGDPTMITPPGSTMQIAPREDIGDVIQYDPSRLKFGITLTMPAQMAFLKGIFSNLQLSLHYQMYYPHWQIPSDVFRGEYLLIRPTDKNADIEIRKELPFGKLQASVFMMLRNAFNDKWVNVQMKELDAAARVKFINSNLSIFPEKQANGAPFPDVLQYRNLPRLINVGVAFTF
ncbi:TonB-dependent receptor, partial [candidate division KSB1 bacterium]|nr:TonB-dependent receptor [candidate division KSB1 bacterium]